MNIIPKGNATRSRSPYSFTF